VDMELQMEKKKQKKSRTRANNKETGQKSTLLHSLSFSQINVVQNRGLGVESYGGCCINLNIAYLCCVAYTFSLSP
jgi:hypothetical protein